MANEKQAELIADGQAICNAIPNVRCVYCRPSQDVFSAEVVDVKLEFDYLPPTVHLLRLDELTAKHLKRANPLFSCPRGRASDALEGYLIDQVQQRLLEAATAPDDSNFCGYYFDKSGLVRLPNGNVFVLGDKLIGTCDRPYILQDSRFHLREGYDNALTVLPSQLIKEPKSLLVMAFIAATAMRTSIVESDVDYQAALYVIGDQGLGKTTLARRMAGFVTNEKGDREALLFDAGSTLAALHDAMNAACNLPIIVDDLCITTSHRSEEHRRELGAQLVREATNAATFTKKLSRSSTVELDCNAGMILTAEFSLEAASDVTRCVMLPVTHPLHLPDALTPKLVGSALLDMLDWFRKKHDKAISVLLHSLNTPNLGDQKHQKRVLTNMAVPKWAFNCFLQAAQEKGVPFETLHKLSTLFHEEMEASLTAQDAQLAKIAAEKKSGNIAYIILGCLENECFNLCEKKHHLHKSDGIIWKGRDLCIKGQALEHHVRRQNGYGSYTIHKIVSELKDLNALCINEDGAMTIRLGKDKHGLNLPRVYRIRLDVLEEGQEKY